MSKIRVNELARELEVKPGVVLDLLPQFGVQEKKTHSSSIEDDVAALIRASLTERKSSLPAGKDEEAPPAVQKPAPAAEVKETEENQKKEEKPAVIEPPGAPAKALPTPPVKENIAVVAATAPQPKTVPPVPPRIPAPPAAAGRGPVRPVAPPLGGHAPSIPIPSRTIPAHPAVPAEKAASAPRIAAEPPVAPPAAPVAPAARRAPKAPAKPAVTARPAVEESVHVPPGAPELAPAAERPAPASGAAAPEPPVPPVKAKQDVAPPAPAAPLPRDVPIGPRPGQIISGPRQPLPGGEAPRRPTVAPGIPRPPAVPQMARPQNVMPPRAYQGQERAAQPTRPPLAGQPAARPVVPPRADILARLQQTQTRAVPGQPPAPRPGAPVPGQPIYPGARRSPARPAPGGLGLRPIRPRGPHPTTPVPEPPPPTTEAGRRDAGKKRSPQRDREIEREGILKPFGRKQAPMALPVVDREITLSEGITVKELSEKLGVKASLVIKRLLEKAIFANINQPLDVKLGEELSREFGARPMRMSYEEEAVQVVDEAEVEADFETRPPVVTIMGHVDHGKTSLLDAVRQTNVAGSEAGGITQHIGAYHVELNGRKVVFIDTPGHEAFTRMRARGSKVTDIVVLVVAADDGVMPQTREAIDHARAAKVPIVVAVNKIDKPDAQPERVKQQLTDLGLMPEEWGGDTPFVAVSAKQKQHLELLLEMILLVADMQELKGNPSRPAVATVLEAKLDRGRGPVATLLVRNGVLRVGDHFLCGTVFGKVRALYGDRGEQVREAGPSMPVELLGFESLPEVGDTLQVVTDLAKARQIADFRETKAREAAMAKTRVSLDQFHAQLREGETKELNIILKADVGGTAEVLSETLQKLSTEKVQIRVISAGVGAITESDVDLAAASDAIIIGFNVRPDRKATERADLEKVDIRLHTIIYELTDEIKRAMVGMLEPVFKEVYRGRAQVRETFRIAKVGTVAGCYVDEGAISRDCEIRLLRDNVVIHTGRLESLKRFKNDASEVKAGLECGLGLAGYNDVKPGDVIEGFVKEKVAPDLGV